MKENLRWKYRRNYIVRFLIGKQYDVLENQEKGVDKFLGDVFQLLEPIHRDAMIAHYIKNKDRTAQAGQNIFHGRKALRAVLSSRDDLDMLKELCHAK